MPCAVAGLSLLTVIASMHHTLNTRCTGLCAHHPLGVAALASDSPLLQAWRLGGVRRRTVLHSGAQPQVGLPSHAGLLGVAAC
jgi:hypothetical protein